jgi:hypothetical protein
MYAVERLRLHGATAGVAALDAVLSDWQDELGGAPQCAQQRADVRLVTLEPEAFEVWCPPRSTRAADGCLRYVPEAPTVLLRAGVAHTDDSWRELIRHEGAHWLEACSGRHPDTNPSHDDGEVWGVLVGR